MGCCVLYPGDVGLVMVSDVICPGCHFWGAELLAIQL